MAQKKSHEVDGWLARPAAGVWLVLCYGPDRGLVSERATRFATLSGLPLDDPFSVVKIESSVLEKDPGRLIDEAQAIAMFAAKRLIWIRGAGSDKRLVDDVKTLLASPPADTLILIEAGDLKKGVGLRALIEGADDAMALPCYADAGRDLDRLIDEELGRAGLTIGLDARTALRNSLGGDRLASRGELQKLALYAHGASEVTLADIRNAISDVSETSADEAVDAMLAGDIQALETAIAAAMTTSAQTFFILSSSMRQLQAMQLLRAAFDGGKNAQSVVASARPPVFFSRRSLVEKAVTLWTPERIIRALQRLQATVLMTRKRPELAVAATRQLLLSLTMETLQASRRR